MVLGVGEVNTMTAEGAVVVAAPGSAGEIDRTASLRRQHDGSYSRKKDC